MSTTQEYEPRDTRPRTGRVALPDHNPTSRPVGTRATAALSAMSGGSGHGASPDGGETDGGETESGETAGTRRV